MLKRLEKFNTINLLMMLFWKENILIYVGRTASRIRDVLYLNTYLLRGGDNLRKLFIIPFIILLFVGCKNDSINTGLTYSGVGNKSNQQSEIGITSAEVKNQEDNKIENSKVDKIVIDDFIIEVGPNGDKSPTIVNHGDTVKLIRTYEGEYAQFPIFITCPEGVSWENNSISITSDGDWEIWEGNRPGGMTRCFYVNTFESQLKKANISIETILDVNGKQILDKAFEFCVTIE